MSMGLLVYAIFAFILVIYEDFITKDDYDDDEISTHTSSKA